MSFKSSKKRVALVAVIASYWALNVGTVKAVTVSWDGGAAGTGNNFSTAANWVGDALPASGNDVLFNSVTGGGTIATSLSLGGNVVYGSMTFDTNLPATLSVNSNVTGTTTRTLTLNDLSASGTLINLTNNVSGTVNFLSGTTGGGTGTMSLILGASGNINVGNATGLLSLPNVISETGGARSINKTGPGTLLLSGTNTFTGGTTLTSGTLVSGATNALGATAGTFTLAGGDFRVTATRTTPNPVNVTGNATITGATTAGAAAAHTFTGALTSSGTPGNGPILTLAAHTTTGNDSITLNGDNSGFKGTISLAVNAATSGVSTLNITGTTAASTNLSNAKIEILGSSIGNAGHVIRLANNTSSTTTRFGELSGTGRIAGSSTNSLNHTLEIGNLNTNSVYSGDLITFNTNTINLKKVGTGSLTLSGDNDYNGTTTISNGTLIAGIDALVSKGDPRTGAFFQGASITSNLFNFGPNAHNMVDGDRIMIYSGLGAADSAVYNQLPMYVINSTGTTFKLSLTPNGSEATFADVASANNSVAGAFFSQPTAFGSGTTPITLGDATGSPTLLAGTASTPTLTIARDITVAAGGGTPTFGSTENGNSIYSGAISLGQTTNLTSASIGGNALLVSGALNGAGGLNKVGVGKVTLSNGSNGYNGTTTITTGTLSLGTTGSLTATSAIDVKSGATFDVSGLGGGFTLPNNATLKGAGNITGSILASGGTNTIAPGDNAIGTLAISGDMSLSGTTGLSFELGTSPGGANDKITTGGNLDLNGTYTFNITPVSGTLGTGSYPLITYNTLSGTVNSNAYSIAGGNTRQIFAIVDDSINKHIDLSVTGNAANLIWAGGLNANAWDLVATANWTGGGGDNRFYNSDSVTFNNAGVANNPVDVVGTLVPLTVTFSNTTGNNYSTTGSGAISSTLAFNVSGSGNVTLNHSGLTTVGTDLAASGAGILSLTNGPLAVTNNFTVSGAQNVSLNNSGGTTVSDNLNIGGSGNFDLLSGTLAVTNQLHITGTGNVTFNNSGSTTVGGNLTDSGSGTFNISSGSLAVAAFENSGSAIVNVLGSSLTTTGNFTNSGTGSVAIANGDFSVGGNLVQSGSGTTTIANNGSAITIPGQIQINGGKIILNRTDAPLTISNVITGTGTLRNEGLIIVTLNTANLAFDGTIEVAAGVIRAVGNNSLGSGVGGTTVSSGATLEVRNNTTPTEIVTLSGTGVPGFGGALVNNSGDNVIGRVKGFILTGDATIGATGSGATTATRSYLVFNGGGSGTNGHGYNLAVNVDAGGNINNFTSIDWIGLGDTNLNNIAVSGGGQFYIGGNTTLGLNTGTLTLHNNTQLGFYGSLNTNPSTGLIDKPILTTGTVASIQCWQGNASISSPITIDSDLEIDTFTQNNSSNSIFTLNGAITEANGSRNVNVHLSANATTSRTGTVVFGADNNYTGTTTIGGGGGMLGITAGNDRITLILGNGGATGSAGTGPIVINTLGALTLNRTGTYTFANSVSGPGLFRSSAVGSTVLLPTAQPNFTGSVHIVDGTFEISDNLSLGVGDDLTNVNAWTAVFGGTRTGQLTLTNNIAVADTIYLGARSTSLPQIINKSGNNTLAAVGSDVNGGAGTFYNIQSDSGLLTITGDVSGYDQASAQPNDTFVFSGASNGIVSGKVTRVANAATDITVGVQKDGAGTWSLNGANDYAGPTTVNGGVLNLSATSNVGSATAATTVTAGTLNVPAGAIINTSGLANNGNTNVLGTMTIATGGGVTGTGNLVLGVDGVQNSLAARGIRQHTLTINDGVDDVTQTKITLAQNGGNAGLLITGSTTTDATPSLNIGNNAAIDLYDNDAIIWYEAGNVGNTLINAKAAYDNWYNNTDPNGPQIQSSGLIDQSTNDPNHPTTLVIINNGQLNYPEWGGEVLPVDVFDQVLIKYTYVGDVDLNGQVDSVDYQILVGSIGDIGNQPYDLDYSWIYGDMDGDGFVNSVDYQQFVGNLGQGIGNPLGGEPGASATGGLGGSPIPEPSTWLLGTLAAAGMGAMGLRRRRNAG